MKTLRAGRSASPVPPRSRRERETVTAWRKVSRMVSELHGTGDYEHSIEIGKHWHGKWQSVKRWDTFADFMRCAKGEAPPNFDLADSFRSKRVPGSILKMLEKPLDLPFVQRLEFDKATKIDIR